MEIDYDKVNQNRNIIDLYCNNSDIEEESYRSYLMTDEVR